MKIVLFGHDQRAIIDVYTWFFGKENTSISYDVPAKRKFVTLENVTSLEVVRNISAENNGIELFCHSTDPYSHLGVPIHDIDYVFLVCSGVYGQDQLEQWKTEAGKVMPYALIKTIFNVDELSKKNNSRNLENEFLALHDTVSSLNKCIQVFTNAENRPLSVAKLIEDTANLEALEIFVKQLLHKADLHRDICQVKVLSSILCFSYYKTSDKNKRKVLADLLKFCWRIESGYLLLKTSKSIFHKPVIYWQSRLCAFLVLGEESNLDKLIADISRNSPDAARNFISDLSSHVIEELKNHFCNQLAKLLTIHNGSKLVSGVLLDKLSSKALPQRQYREFAMSFQNVEAVEKQGQSIEMKVI